MSTAAGTIFRSGGKERVPYATVKAYQGDQTFYATAGEAGEFTLSSTARNDPVAFERELRQRPGTAQYGSRPERSRYI
jgi:hypothetical protein